MIEQEELQSQRAEFWGSRVGGSHAIWSALQTSAEAFLAGDAGLATAILSVCYNVKFCEWTEFFVQYQASDISMPNGSLELCYDELGNEYKIPDYCYTTPLNISTKKSVDKAEVLQKKTIVGTPLKLKIRVNPGDQNLGISCFLVYFVIVDIVVVIDAETSHSIGELKTLILEASTAV